MTTPSAPPPAPRPSMPPATDVPDDAIHGDDLDAAREARVLAQQAAPPAAPPPPTTTAPQAPAPVHRGHGRTRSWLAVLAGVGILTGSFGGFLGSSDDEVHTYKEAVTTIVVADGGMDVEIVTGAATGTVEVTRELHWSLASARPSAVEAVQEGTLTLSDPECSGFGRCSVDYVISVPEGVDLVVRSESGDLSAEGDFGSLELETDSGDIEAAGLTATDLALTTGSGDIELDAFEAQQVRAETGSGDIELEVAQAPDQLAAKTGSGDVEVRVPDDETYKVDATTGSGDRNVDVPTGTGQEHVILVDTGSGDVDIDDN